MFILKRQRGCGVFGYFQNRSEQRPIQECGDSVNDERLDTVQFEAEINNVHGQRDALIRQQERDGLLRELPNQKAGQSVLNGSINRPEANPIKASSINYCGNGNRPDVDGTGIRGGGSSGVTGRLAAAESSHSERNASNAASASTIFDIAADVSDKDMTESEESDDDDVTNRKVVNKKQKRTVRVVTEIDI